MTPHTRREDLLASLLAQAQQDGADVTTLRGIVSETSELAAERVLDRMGLADADAQADMDELRELLQAWRDAKASAWKAVIDWSVRAILALLLVGIAVRLGAWELVR